ncbi:MAG: ComEC/Rec2 family competence protein, partial [Bacteroidota bacterium]|nr:ComEC/Rec2 family competence protein [Bacteroidota bacterium]
IDLFSGMRNRIGAWIDDAGLDARQQALVKALVLGQRDELDGEQRTAFARSGTIHVLAVSGMHVGLIYLILGSLLNWSGNSRLMRVIRGFLILIALWLYAGITGGAPSILRATIMFSFITLADMMARRTESVNSLFAAMFLLLLIDPQMLYMIGFQLSFLAVLGIVLFFRPLEELWTPRTWIMRKIWSLAVLSLAAQAFTTPVSLYYFKSFPVWFLPANLIVVTAVGLSVYSSIALIVLHKIPIVGTIIKWILVNLLKIVSVSTAFFSDLPFAYPAIRVDMVMILMLYVSVIAASTWWLWNWRSMRFVGAFALLVLLFSWGLKARSINRGETFTLYDERVGVMASITKGREQVVLINGDRSFEDPYVQRKIEQHGRSAGIERLSVTNIPADGNESTVVGTTIIGGERWKSKDFDVLFVNDPKKVTELSPSTHLDIVILYDLDRISEELLARVEGITDRIVIAGKNHWRSREAAFKWCVDRNIPVHDVFAQGAFILESSD